MNRLRPYLDADKLMLLHIEAAEKLVHYSERDFAFKQHLIGALKQIQLGISYIASLHFEPGRMPRSRQGKRLRKDQCPKCSAWLKNSADRKRHNEVIHGDKS